jgi:hypothetical protein
MTLGDDMGARIQQIWNRLSQIAGVSWKIFSVFILTSLAFFGYFYDFKRPDVSVEITAVAATSTELIDIARLPELKTLKNVLGANLRTFLLSNRAQGYSSDEIERQLTIASSQANTTLAEWNKARVQLSTLDSSAPDFDKQFSELATSELSEDIEEKSSPSTTDRGERLRQAKNSIDEKIKRENDLIAKIAEADREWKAYKVDVLPNKARLIVTCAIGNRGAGATALKPQGLLCANLGEGNYLDLPMKLSGYETSSDLATLPPQSQKVMRFQSEELQTMTNTDNQRFKQFLGNVSPATLYISDVRGENYASNAVPFSPGVYEQKVYDALKQFATKNTQAKRNLFWPFND